jgi:hypothetical protein
MKGFARKSWEYINGRSHHNLSKYIGGIYDEGESFFGEGEDLQKMRSRSELVSVLVNMTWAINFGSFLIEGLTPARVVAPLVAEGVRFIDYVATYASLRQMEETARKNLSTLLMWEVDTPEFKIINSGENYWPDKDKKRSENL